MTEEQIKYMVERFLGWRLPENFNPDAGISFKPTFNEHTAWPMKHEPVGTNLFDYNQATEMVCYMINELPEQEIKMSKFVPLGARVLVYVDEAKAVSAGGVYLPDTKSNKVSTGGVVAVGNGRYSEIGDEIPMNVKVGDKVAFLTGYGIEIVENGIKCLLLDEAHLLGVIQ